MSFEPMPSHGLNDAEEHRNAARRHLREVYLQAKLDYLRMQKGYQSKDDATSMKLARVVGELRDMYGVEPPMRARQRERLEDRESSYVGGQIPASERDIPSYSAVRDRHCTYVGSKNFKNSPFMRLKLAADRAVRYFGGGGARAPTSEENLLKSNLLFLSPLGKSNAPPPGLQQTPKHANPLRKKLNPKSPPIDALGSTITPMALMLSDAVGPRPLAPNEVKRSRNRGLGPSPASRKRNKLEHDGEEGGLAGPLRPRSPNILAGEGDDGLPTTPPLDIQLRTPPHSAEREGRLSSPEGGRQLVRSPSVANARGSPRRSIASPRRSVVSPRRSVCSPRSPRASDVRGGSSHDGSSAGSLNRWAGDMEGLSEGLALLERLRQEVLGIKHELVVRGLIPPTATPELEDGERPPTVSDDTWLQRAFHRESSPPMPPGAPRVFTQVLLLQDRLRVQGYPYATQLSVWLTEVGALEVRARNMDRAFDLVPFTVHPIFVNKLTGWTPEQFAGLEGGEARQKKLEPILDELRVQEDGKTLSLLIDPFIYEGVHPLGNRHYQVRVLRLAAGNGLVVMAEPASVDAQTGRLKLVVYDSELEVLLCHQPGLYRRANAQWSTQQFIAEWLVARLSVYTDDSYEGPDGERVSTSHLVLDRSIRLPADKSWTTAGGEDTTSSSRFVLSAWQEDAAIAIECRRAAGEGGVDGQEAAAASSSRERVEWVEVQAFIGSTMLNTASAELLNAEEEPLPQTPLEYLLARLTVGCDGVLHVDRVMYKEVRNVSGCTVMLHGAIFGPDLVYRAQRVKLPGGGGDRGPEDGGQGEVFTLGITEKEAVKLMLKEPAEVRKVLFAYLNRALLCRALTDMLRLVEDRGSLRLETALYVPSDLLKIAVRHRGGVDGKEEVVVMLGSVLVHSHTTLAQVRKLVKEKLDPESLPPLFSFETHGVPCSTKQEGEWLAKDLLPLLFLVPRHGSALFDEFRAAHAKAAKRAHHQTPRHKHRRPRTTGTDMSDEMGSADHDTDEDDEQMDDSPTRRRRRGKTTKKTLRKTKQRENRKSVADLLSAPNEDGDMGGGAEGEAEAKDEREEGGERDDGATGEDELLEEEEKRVTRRAGKKGNKGKDKGGEMVAVPLMARVCILEGDRVVRCSEDLRHVIKPGYLLRLEFPTGPEYKVSGHPDDPYDAHSFTLDKPWVRYVPGQEAAAADKPPPIPIKTAAEIAREKQEVAARARLQEGSALLSTAAQEARPDPGSKSLDQLTREVVQEEEMQQPVFYQTGSTPTAAGASSSAPSATTSDAPEAAPKEGSGMEQEDKREGEAPPAEAKEEKGTTTVVQVAEVEAVNAPTPPVQADAKAVSTANYAATTTRGFFSAMFGGAATVRTASPPKAHSSTLSPKSIIKAMAPTGKAAPAAATGAGQLSGTAQALQTGVAGPVEYKNLTVYRVMPKAEDTRPQWRAEFDMEKVPYKFEHKKSREVTEVLHVRLRLSRLESLCKDVFTTYYPLHQQRVDFFDKVSVEVLVRALHNKLTAGRLLGDTLPVNTWQGFVEELELLPRHAKLLVSPAKLNELMDPVAAVPEDRRTGSAGRMGAGLPMMTGSPMFKPNGGDRRNLSPSSMASLMAMEEAMAPRWSDFVDANGKIDYHGFLCLLKELAGLHYPRLRLEPEHALRTLALEKLIFRIPDLHTLAWSEAKRMAMEVESKRQAVAMRLQAFQRRKVAYRWYHNILTKCIRIQAAWRRAIHHWHYQVRMAYLEEDRCIRMRHVSALRIQTVYRIFRARKAYQRLIDVREQANRERLAARRCRQHEKRRIRQMATLYRASRIFGGTCTLIKIFKRDGRRSSKNCDMIIRCYIPITQETIDFDLPEAQVRGFIERFINRAGLSVQELTDPENVQCLANRLLVKKVGDKYSVVFSRRSASERGVKVQRRAARVSGCSMVVTVYRTSDEWAFRAYDLNTCEDLRVAVTTKTLRKWLQDEERKDMFAAIVVKRRKLNEAVKVLNLMAKVGATLNPEKAEEAEAFLKSVGGKEAYEAQLMEDEKVVAHNFEPVLLQPRNQPALLRWMVDRITMYKRKGDHQRVLVLSYEIDRLQRDTSAAKIQGLYRMLKAKHVVRALIREQYEKQMDWASKRMVYVKRSNDARSTRKPQLLGPEDLDPPKDEYRPMRDMQGKRYFFNPATGQVSRMSPTDAARVMQRAIRRRLDQEIGRPCMQDIVKAMVMISQAPTKYQEFPDRLTTCLNFAMVLHTQTFEWDHAREVYQKTLKKGGENPVVMRCYAIFLLASCDEPRQINFQRANELFKLAEVMDPGHERFKTALECFFKWSLVVNPQSQYAMLNFALVMQGVVGDHDKAEAYYRRALTLSAYDPKVLQNFDDYLKERLPGGAYGSKGPSSFVVRRSEVVEAKELEWGEWVRMRDTKAIKPEFEKYWYDKLTLKTSWERPNFADHVKARLKRSQVIRNLGDWKQYNDPMLKGGKGGFTFWCHSLSGIMRLDDPFG